MENAKKYTVYIDEAGDLGIQRGTKWFIITAVIVEKEKESDIRAALSHIKSKLNLKEIHLRKLNDFFKTSYVVAQIKDKDFTTVNVLMDTDICPLKDSIKTYNYMCRILLERVSWFLRSKDSRADIVLSSRGTSRDKELITYIQDKLLTYRYNQLFNRFDKITSKQASQWDMLQLADICATTMFRAYEINSYGFVVPCYMNNLKDRIYSHNGSIDKYGLKFGVYLSPWDRNAECYGQGEAYNKFFIEQLTELLTNYGEVHEVWFDGANGEGPNGKKQEYDWDAILKTIRRLQPKAVTAIMGDDVRWVGNEGGLGRTTEWSATALMPNSYPGSDEVYKRLGINAMSKDLGSRELVSKASDLFWYPSEVDVSISPGWFYHAEQDNQVRSLANLVNIYYRSVGCNSVLLLNIPPDKRGLMHENDVKRIKELTEYIKKTFADNKVEKGNRIWTAKVGDTKEYKVRKNTLVNTFLIQEDITKGQRVEGFTVEVFANGAWHHVGEGTTVGYKRLLPFSDSHAEKVRVTITGARGTVNISNIGLYYAEPLVDKTMKVTLSDVPVDGWKTVGMDAAAAIDGKQETVWKTETLTPLVVDMGKEVEIAGFSYAPAQEEDLTGTIYKYNFYVSRDGKDWMKCDATGEFSNIMHNPVPYFVRFGKTYPARYFKLEPVTEINNKAVTAVGEIGVLLK